MNGRAELMSVDKPNKLYYGIRKCDSLKDPAILLSWTDCKFFVGTERDDNIEYQTFERIFDAVRYVTFQQEEDNTGRPEFAPEEDSSSLPTLLKRSADQVSLPSSTGDNSPKKRLLPEITTLFAPYISNDIISTTEAIDLDVDMLDLDSVDADENADASTTDGILQTHRTSALPVFGRHHLDLMKEYTDVYGTTVLRAERCQGKFKHLQQFLYERRFNFSNSTPASVGDPETASEVPFEKPMREPEPAFERDFKLLQEYKDSYGTTVLSAQQCQGKFDHLPQFLYEWRFIARKIAIDRPKDDTLAKMRRLRIRRLVSLGFLGEEEESKIQALTDAANTSGKRLAQSISNDTADEMEPVDPSAIEDLRPGSADADHAELIDLGVDLGVDPKTISESAPASNDGSVTISQVTVEQRKGRLSEAFERRLERLQWYKETYGTTVLLPEHLQGEFKRLKMFLYDQRANRADHGEAQQSIATESRIRRLVSLGFLDEEEALQTQVATVAPTTENLVPEKKPIRGARFSLELERNFQLMKWYKDAYSTHGDDGLETQADGATENHVNMYFRT